MKTIILAAMLGIAATASARADILAAAARASSTNVSSAYVSSGQQVPLFENGSTSLSFKTTVANQRIMATYNTGCSVAAGVSVQVRMLVDGWSMFPDAYRPLCGTHDANSDGPINGSVQATAVLAKAGTHNITVLVYLPSGSRYNVSQILASSLVVEK